MLIACWSPKGGSGTTVVSCGLAIVLARSQPSPAALIADLSGDVPAALGLPEPDTPGLCEWMAAASDVNGDALGRLETRATQGLGLLAHGRQHASTGSGSTSGAARGEELAVALHATGRQVVVDCGSAASGPALAVAAAADLSLLVLRPCYLALRRALAAPIRPSAVVLVEEPGRSLTARDVEDVLGVPVRSEVAFDPSIARAVDAGLLTRRVPRALERALRQAA